MFCVDVEQRHFVLHFTQFLGFFLDENLPHLKQSGFFKCHFIPQEKKSTQIFLLKSMFFKIFFPSGTLLKRKACVLLWIFFHDVFIKHNAFPTHKDIHIRLKSCIKLKKLHLGIFLRNGKLEKNQNRSGNYFLLAKTVLLN